jgi:hypothetical protein
LRLLLLVAALVLAVVPAAVVVVVRVTMMLPGNRFAPPGEVVARGWCADGLQMRMMAVAMVVNIVGVDLVVVGWF